MPPIKGDLQHVDHDARSTDIDAHSSSDSSLTAFAQLGALRLDAQRATISLFGRHEQFVLAEATRTLSLQDDNEYTARDELWLGACTMTYARSFCKSVADFPASVKSPADLVHVVTDLAHDDAYENHPDVMGYPNIRFLACVPIVSPKGIVIGAYSILDDKPRGPLHSDHSKFLTDMASTVMDYLTANRSRSQHLRGERMIVGLGSFLEGKGSLRTSWLDQTEKSTTPGQDDDVEGHTNVQQQERQRSGDMITTMKNSRSRPPFRLSHPQSLNSQRPVRLEDQPRFSSSSKPSLPRVASDHLKLNETDGATVSAWQEKSKSKSNKETYTNQINETFSRAANLVRETLEVEGVVFFDANFGFQESLVNHDRSDNESSVDGSASEGESNAPTGFTQPELSQLRAENSGETTLNPCSILGFATSHDSSVNGELLGDTKIALSESFVGGLLRRYPGGKIFNFGEDGSISSGDTSDGVFKSFTARGNKKFKKTRKSVMRQDAMALLNLAPESRSIVLWPVWDSHKSRWYAGALAWTRVPQRVFTLDDELTFCLAFGNSIMAEVHRLGALLAERAKSDLLAGISHELRSPLHGIFGTAELLNDTAMDALQQGFVHTITSCASTLLGSIDQLLEFSSINDLRTPMNPSSSDRASIKPGDNSHAGKIGADSKVQLDAAVEDTIDTAFAGFSFYNARLPLRGASGISFDRTNPVANRGGTRLILDIDNASNWSFATSPGAWRVILTNILGNALKYTQKGYISVSLKAKRVLSKQNGEPLRSAVTLKVKDTGCGMHPEFLQNGFFTAFSQENDLFSGNGLGASITRRTIASLNGDIQVKSQQEVGTEVVVSLTLDHVSEHTSAKPLGDNTDNYPLALTIGLVRQKSVGILGLGTSESDTALASSLQKFCGQWLQMDARVIAPSDTQFRHCEFYIAPHEYLDIDNLEIQPIAPGLGARFTSPVIIICPTPRVAHSLFVASQQRGDSEVLEFITQPCGPRKLAKALEMCIQRQQQRVEASDGVKIRPAASRTTTLDKLKRQPEVKLTSHLASTRQDFAKPPGKLNSFPKGGNSTHDSSHAVLAPEENKTTGEQNGHQPSPQEEVSPTILLVDDNDINLKLLVAFMKKLGCYYITAQNGQEALESFKENASQIGIVLMGRFSMKQTAGCRYQIANCRLVY